MALKKTIVNDMGIPVQYWKITGINMNFALEYADITLTGYLTEDTRQGNLNPVETKKFRATRKNFENIFSVQRMNASSNIVSLSYDYVKSFDEFKNAQDI